jgi:hypothetical protein
VRVDALESGVELLCAPHLDDVVEAELVRLRRRDADISRWNEALNARLDELQGDSQTRQREVEALQRVLGVGSQTLLLGGYGSATDVPALAIRQFRFTGKSAY